MIALPFIDSDQPLMRAEALHALAYCPRLFYMQEVERLSAPDDRVFAGRQLHAAIDAEDEGEAATFEFTSETWGLTGKVDALKRRDGSVIPYEHKRGRATRDTDASATAWPSDRLQVIARRTTCS